MIQNICSSPVVNKLTFRCAVAEIIYSVRFFPSIIHIFYFNWNFDSLGKSFLRIYQKQNVNPLMILNTLILDVNVNFVTFILLHWKSYYRFKHFPIIYCKASNDPAYYHFLETYSNLFCFEWFCFRCLRLIFVHWHFS